MHDLPRYFTDAQGFFYRPLAKAIMFYLYMIFSFQPQGYHVINLLLHWLMAVGVYWLARIIIKKKYIAFVCALLFLLLPMHEENLFWISTMSINLASVSMIYGLITYLYFRQKRNIALYILTCCLAIVSLLSYEGAVIFPFLLIVVDLFITRPKYNGKTYLPYFPFVIFSVLYVVGRPFVHALHPSGDYAYNMSHLIPNLFGNTVGYWSLFFFGQHAFVLYEDIRNGLKVYAFIISILLGLLALTVGINWFVYRKKIALFYLKHNISMVLFVGIFSISALLPFLGLGNITQRYGYFASIAFVLLLGYGLEKLCSIFKKDKRIYFSAITIFALLISAWYGFELQNETKQWQTASQITYRTLVTFRTQYEGIPAYSVIYFANVPVKYGQAWVFPWGLGDGLWFIYRDPTIQVIQTKTVDEARADANLQQDTTKKIYIFSFNDKGELSEEQR